MSSLTTETDEAVTALLRLRRLAAERSRDERVELRAVEDYVRGRVSVSVRPSDAARLLGLSQPSLKRWLDSGDIASVLTPAGRREVPLSELLDLLEELERLDESERRGRPISRIIRARRSEAEESIDIERLLPRRSRGHRVAELQALAYHRVIAERLDEALVDEASRRLASWRRNGQVHGSWIDAWEEILERPLPAIAKAIAADTSKARELRQTSPFAGALTEQERKVLVRAVRDRGNG